MSRRHRLVLFVATVVTAASITGTAAAAEPRLQTERRSLDGPRPEATASGERKDVVLRTNAFPGENGRVAYTRAEAGQYPASIWTMDDIGDGQEQLLAPGVGTGDNSPAWSPGGTLLAFSRDTTTSEADFVDEIYTVKANGTGLKRLTNNAVDDYAPAFSPDGARIVFVSNRPGNYELYSMKIDGSDVKRLTNTPGEEGPASWSPDGTKIAFSSDRAGNAEIYTMKPDGSSVQRLTTNAAFDVSPAWSPDGAVISFTTDRTGTFDIFVMNATGGAPTNATGVVDAEESRSAFSPSSDFIAFDWDYFGDYDVVMTDGVDIFGLAQELSDEWNPDWQPIPAFPLVDAQFSTFEQDIIWAFTEGITVGCSDERYCPDDLVTRGQMAAFLVRALDLPPTATDYFNDDETSTFENQINALREAQITLGCAPSKYCPTDPVTRGQMAAFLVRALELPATATDHFTDDETSIYENNINALAEAGITTGCTPTTYCPTANVTRGQMAAFLRRALD